MLSTPSMLWIQLSPWAQLERARLRLWAPVQIRMLPPKYFRQVWKKPKFAEICFEHLSSHVFPCKAAQMRSYSWKEFDLVDWHLTGCAAERFPFLAKSLIRLVLTHCTGSCQITLVRKRPSRALSVKKCLISENLAICSTCLGSGLPLNLLLLVFRYFLFSWLIWCVTDQRHQAVTPAPLPVSQLDTDVYWPILTRLNSPIIISHLSILCRNPIMATVNSNLSYYRFQFFLSFPLVCNSPFN